MRKVYNIIVPRIDRTGPTNMAFEIGRQAKIQGWEVKVWGLGGDIYTDNTRQDFDLKILKASDLTKFIGVIHTHCLRPDLVGFILKLLNPKIKLVTTIHNHFLLDLSYDHSKCKVYCAFQLWRFCLKFYDRRVCISNTMARYYRKKFLGYRFDVIYNFNESKENFFVEDLLQQFVDRAHASSKLVLVYVGSFINRKNVRRLVEFVINQTECSLVMCGRSGNLIDEINNKICASNSEDRIRIFEDVKSVVSVINVCDLLVLPSHAEGMPMVVLESIKASKPFMLSNIAVHREISKLGLSDTFDRFTFNDFNLKSTKLLQRFNDKEQLRDYSAAVFEKHFSAAAAFQSYINGFESSSY